MIRTLTRQEAADKLAVIKGVTVLGTYRLRLGKQTFDAVEYREVIDVSPGCPAYDRGERTYTRHNVYVCGAVPKQYLASHLDGWKLKHGSILWVTCYSTEKGVAERPEERDMMFILSLDPHPGRTNGKPLRLVSASTLD